MAAPAPRDAASYVLALLPALGPAVAWGGWGKALGEVGELGICTLYLGSARNDFFGMVEG